jgi:hypothetical protein
MPYGSALIDSIESSGNLTVTGNLTTTGTIASATGITYPLVSGTAQNTTSGTSIPFTGIPSWVKRITLMFNGVSTSGTSNYLVQLGTVSGFTTTGYEASSAYILSNTAYLNTLYTAGFGIALALGTNVVSGALTFSLVSGNIWVMSGVLQSTQNASFMNSGRISLASTLTQLRLTTVNGTDTFDAGTVNILYE